MIDDKRKKVFDFIIKCSKDKNILCDYFEIMDFLKISIRHENNNELSKILNELKNENKIIAKIGEYLPKE